MSVSQEPIVISLRVKIFPRGKKKIWTAEFHSNGRHCRRSLKTSNLRIAKERASNLDREIAHGDYLPSPSKRMPRVSQLSITDAVAQFIAFCKREGRRRKTYRRYEGMLTKFATFAQSCKVIALSGITLPLIDAYQADTQDSLEDVTKHNELANLKRFLFWCKQRSYVQTNPLGERKLCPPKPKSKASPTLEHINAVLEKASAHHRPLLATIAFTGMRSGEAQRLLVEDIDLAGNWIHIVSRPGAETKNGESRKTPIHHRLRRILEALPEKTSGYFFTAQPSLRYPDGGHCINTKHLNDSFKNLLTKLKLPVGGEAGFTVHSHADSSARPPSTRGSRNEPSISGSGTPRIRDRYKRSTTT